MNARPSTSAVNHQAEDVMDEMEDIKPDQAELLRLQQEDHIEELIKLEAREHNQTWMDYVRKNLKGQGQETHFISPHHRSATIGVKWWLCAKLLVVVTKKKNCVSPDREPLPYHAVQIMKFDSAHNGKLRVRCMCPSSNRNYFNIKHEDIVVEREKLGGMLEKLQEETFKKHPWLPRNMFYPIEEWEKLAPRFNTSAYVMIKKGMILEMQLEENPNYVTIGQVVRNFRGLLGIKFGREYIRYFHMTSPYLHEIGWVNRMKATKCQNVQLVPGTTDNDPIGPSVPEYIMWKNGLPVRNLKQDEMVVYLDHGRQNFYFAHVKRIPGNIHFFHLMVGKEYVTNPETKKIIYFHMSHEKIFSYKIIRKLGIKVNFPLDFKRPVTDTNHYSDRIFLYETYFVSTNGAPARMASEAIGSHWEYLDFWNDLKSEKKNRIIRDVETLKYIEVLLPNECGLAQMHSAMVHKASLYLLTVKVAGKEGLLYFHPFDQAVYPFGAANDFSMKFGQFEMVDEANEEL